MNLNTVRRHYNKLTRQERFAAIVAAGSRGDDEEQSALVKSAPRKHFSVPDTWGLSQAFLFLTSYHLIEQLGCAADFYLLMFLGDCEDTRVKLGDLSYSLDDVFTMLGQRILTNLEAFQAICKEYNVDYRAILEMMPHLDTIEMTEAIMRAVADDDPPNLPDLQATVDNLRNTVERIRGDWE